MKPGRVERDGEGKSGTSVMLITFAKFSQGVYG